MVDGRCWNDHVAIRMGVEIDERATFLLSSALATFSALRKGRIMGLCSSARIEVRVRISDGLACRGLVHIGLLLAHCDGRVTATEQRVYRTASAVCSRSVRSRGM